MSKDVPACQLRPLPLGQLSFEHDGVEQLRWNHHPSAPRPYFYPLIGPSGSSLVRMGHPGAANHDHHCGVWFAHHDVAGVDFWSNTSPATIRQTRWLDYVDGPQQAVMAVESEWLDGHDPKPLLQQKTVACFQPREEGEFTLELQASFTATSGQLELGTTNFGFLAIRVAKSISEHFGGGTITNSLGKTGEAVIFGKNSRWMDYSGPNRDCAGEPDAVVTEGITCFDHPSNPGQPARWHVREDGWMGPSVCRQQPVLLQADKPLIVRYLLDIHSGSYDADRAQLVADEFSGSVGWGIRQAEVKHRQNEVYRLPG